jgi:hypothetical protein
MECTSPLSACRLFVEIVKTPNDKYTRKHIFEERKYIN